MGIIIEDQELREALNDLNTLLGIANNLRSLFGNPNDSPNLGSINGKLNRIINYLADPSWGMVAAWNQRTNIDLHIFNLQTDVTALGSPQQAGSPVTLPTTPPAGYGGLGPSDIFDAVWLTNYASDLDTPYDYVKYGGLNQISVGQTTGYRPDGGIFAYYYTILDTAGVHPTYYPSQDFTTIMATDDLLSWLTRINSTASCFWWSGPGSSVGVNGDNGDGPAQFITVFDDSHFQQIKAELGIGSPKSLAQVWPGLANVTLGSPVALDLAVDVSELCNGVLIALTGTPPGKPTYQIGSALAVAHIGQIAFFSDNGDMEYPQNLSMPNEVYCPLSMTAAAGVRIRCVPGVTGTVTTWTINS